MPGRKLFLAAMAAAAAILTYQLFVPPVTGLADQGDFVRTIRRFGYGPQHGDSLRYIYVEPKYVRDAQSRQPRWEQASSEYLFVGAALLLNRLISKDGALDITVVGFVHLIAFLAAFARLLWVTRRLQARAIIWIGALVALTDAGYAVYWNSFYTEPASCIFLLLLLAEGIELGCTGRLTPMAALRWTAWSVLWALAKPQNAPPALLLALATFGLCAWTQSAKVRAAAIAGACAVVGSAAYGMFTMPAAGRMANTYNMIFRAVLPESKSPAEDLKALGLDPQLARYAGTAAWSAGTHFDALAASGTLDRVNNFTVLRFYLLRPARMWRRVRMVLPKITFLRGEWYGNFEPSSGMPPAALSQAFNLWSGFHEHVLPRFTRIILLALCGWPFAMLWKWVRTADEARRRQIELSTLLPVSCLASLFAAIFGDAFDLVKHMFLFNLLLDACLLWGLATLWRAVARHSTRFRESGSKPSAVYNK
jgi:hypothetical protein